MTLPPALRRLLRRLNVFDSSRPATVDGNARTSDLQSFTSVGKGQGGASG